MKPYLALARAQALSALTYRTNFLLSLGGIAFQLVSLLAVWRVLLAESSVSGFDWPHMRAYLLVAFASGALVSVFADFRMSFRIQSGLQELALFLASMVLLVPLKFLVVYVSTLACFWTQNFIGVLWARQAITSLLSGALVPLVYFPGWLATLAQWSPFAGLTSTPALIFIGRAHGRQALLLVGVQLLWVLVLWFGARGIWRAALRQLTVNGG